MHLEDKFSLAFHRIDEAIKINEFTNRGMLQYYSNVITSTILTDLQYDTDNLSDKPFLVSIDFEKCINKENNEVVIKCFIKSLKTELVSDITNIMRLLLSTTKTDIDKFFNLLPIKNKLDCVIYKTTYENPMLPVRKISGIDNSFALLMSYWVSTLLEYIAMIHSKYLIENEINLSFEIITNYTDNTNGLENTIVKTPYILNKIELEDIKKWDKNGWGLNTVTPLFPMYGLTKEQVMKCYNHRSDFTESFDSKKELDGIKIVTLKTRNKNDK